MKLIKFLFILLLFAFAGGFVYAAMSDIPLQQSEITINIPSDRVFND